MCPIPEVPILSRRLEVVVLFLFSWLILPSLSHFSFIQCPPVQIVLCPCWLSLWLLWDSWMIPQSFIRTALYRTDFHGSFSCLVTL